MGELCGPGLRGGRGLVLLLAALIVVSADAVALASAPRAHGLNPPPETNLQPVIGVLTVPVDAADSPCATFSGGGASCAQVFYVRWLEAAGARVVFMPYNLPPASLDLMLDSVNGVLFTGGGLEAAGLAFDSPYMVAAARVLAAVRAKASRGIFFPLHGTCQGFQVLALLASRNSSVLSYNAFDSEDLSLPLDMSWDAHHSSRIFSADTAPPGIIDTLMLENVTVNMHRDGVSLSAFEGSDALTTTFILLSTNTDRVGRVYVSTVEGWDLPITASQWHPEKAAFEFRVSNPGMLSAHTSTGVAANAYIAAFFVADARRNNQTFATPDAIALFQLYSAFALPVVNAADAAVSGYGWYVVEA